MRPFSTFSRLVAAIIAPSLLLIVACGGGVSGPRATHIDVAPGFLAFDGTSQATLTVTADGVWTVSSDSNWLRTNRTSGPAGTSTVTVTINRGGLTVGNYSGGLVFSGSNPLTPVTVSMRFPVVDGVITDASGEIELGSTSTVTLHERTPSPDVADLASSEIIPGEFLIMLNESMARALEFGASGLIGSEVVASEATLHAMTTGLAGEYGFSVVSDIVSVQFPMIVVRAAGGLDLATMALDGRVKSVEPHLQWKLPPVDPEYRLSAYDFGFQWHYEHINLEEAWGITEGRSSVVVAVIDGGFALQHGDLTGNLLPGYDFANNDSNPGLNPTQNMACAGHGTHVAGTVAATFNVANNVIGVAPGVKIRPVRIGNESGAVECTLTNAAIINGILWAAGQVAGSAPVIPPVDVINMSLGGYGYSAALDAAVQTALNAGVSVVAATGNDGHDNTVAYPAAYNGVIGVSATDRVGIRAWYSNAGQEVDVVAPGGDTSDDIDDDGYVDGVLSLAWNPVTNLQGYQFMQGTSMASPHVAGVVALMKSVNRALTPAQVVAALRATAVETGIPGPDTWYGWGMVDAGAAVEAASQVMFSHFQVRLRSGGSVVASVRAGPSGSFSVGPVASGNYILEVGTDLDGDDAINDSGEYFGSVSVNVNYDGDPHRSVPVTLR